MATPLNFDLEIDNLLPPLTLTLDLTDNPEVRSLEMVRKLHLMKGQDVTLRVSLKTLDTTVTPPALAAVDITGWASRWTARADDVGGAWSSP